MDTGKHKKMYFAARELNHHVWLESRVQVLLGSWSAF